MTVERRKRGAKVTSKPHHGDSRQAMGVRTKGRAQKSAYSILNGHFRVFFPIGPTTTDKRVLSAAVSSVVAKMKS